MRSNACDKAQSPVQPTPIKPPTMCKMCATDQHRATDPQRANLRYRKSPTRDTTPSHVQNVCDMTHSHVQNVCDKTPSHVQNVCDMTPSHVQNVCDMTHSHVQRTPIEPPMRYRKSRVAPQLHVRIRNGINL